MNNNPLIDRQYIENSVKLCDKFKLELLYYTRRCYYILKSKGLKDNIDDNIKFNDKIKWLTLYNCTQQKINCTDKIKLHDYCQEKLGFDICTPVKYILDNETQINKDHIKETCMIKCNHGCKLNMTCNKNYNLDYIKHLFHNYMGIDHSLYFGELHYHFIEKKILIEEYLGNKLFNYNILCFNGIPKFIHYGFYDTNKYKMVLLDLDFKKVNYFGNANFQGNKPDFLNKMIEYAGILSQPFKFVRVDMYYVNNKIYLGELTFSPGSCNISFLNEEKEIEFGKLLDIKNHE